MGIVSVMMAVGIVVAFTIGWFFKGLCQKPTLKGVVYDVKTKIMTVQWEDGKLEQFKGKGLEWTRLTKKGIFAGEADIDTELMLYEKYIYLTKK